MCDTSACTTNLDPLNPKSIKHRERSKFCEWQTFFRVQKFEEGFHFQGFDPLYA